VPAHVAFEDLDHVVAAVIRSYRAVLADVADRGEIELQLAKATGECDLLVIAEVLVRKHQQRVLQPQLVESGEFGFAQVRESGTGHHRTEGAR